MRQEILEVRANLKRMHDAGQKPQFAYGYYAEMPDKIAREMGLLPDFERLKQTDPELYRKFYDNVGIPPHWNFDEDPALAKRLMDEIDDIYKAEYDVADESKLTFDEKVRLFNQKFKYMTELS
jgi:hypothetical protein